MEIVIGERFRLRNKIGNGCFGEIYLGVDEKDNPVALKLEKHSKHGVLAHEAELYQALQGGESIPAFYWFGKQASYDVLAIQKLDKTLEDLRESVGGCFSLKTVLMLADQMISCLEFIHQRGFVHRDLKPENFMFGKADHVFIIDFGLSKRYIDPETNEHVQMCHHQSLTGTARYASVNAMRCQEQSRRDDLESLGYIFVYMLKGKLPWQGIQAPDQRAKFREILDLKFGLPLKELCKDLPDEFRLYLEATRHLEFTEEPKYDEYRAMFKDLFLRNRFAYDFKYDWVSPPSLPPIRDSEQQGCVSVREKKIRVAVKVPQTRVRDTGRKITDRILAGRASAKRFAMPEASWRVRAQQRHNRLCV